MIDTHVHIGGIDLGYDMKEEFVDDLLLNYPLEKIILMNVDGAEFGHNHQLFPLEEQINQIDSLNRVLAFARRYPNKVFVGPWCRPTYEGLTDEFRQLMIDNMDIIRCLKLHSYHSRMGVDDVRFKPYLEFAEEYNLPIVIHTGGCDEAMPYHVVIAAKKHPNLKFILVHMGLGTDHEEALWALGESDNIYGDTTWVPLDVTIRAIKTYGARMMFGSDAPIDVNTYEKEIYQKYFHEIQNYLTEEEYEDLMTNTAKKVFNL